MVFSEPICCYFGSKGNDGLGLRLELMTTNLRARLLLGINHLFQRHLLCGGGKFLK